MVKVPSDQWLRYAITILVLGSPSRKSSWPNSSFLGAHRAVVCGEQNGGIHEKAIWRVHSPRRYWLNCLYLYRFSWRAAPAENFKLSRDHCHPSASPNSARRTAEGEFQSQAATTRGTATLRVTDSGAILELKDFATESSKDLRVFLSPGTLSPGANGELGLTSAARYELGGLKSSQGDQQYEIGSQQWANLPAIGCVVIYDYPARLAYGAANLK
ncbi:DM13 domain-containing protein [Arthrobacter bambusae]|uniref:DM13 domain-containing protein n=1 Tax=Arthrobacter TaxID=1663 RepID=UPI001F5E5378|nr:MULTISPECIES: DM13 domain-containing protein [Arthrobacter]MCI0142690.1 DM13 domain-containing protein [Arthrobacter bambusae]